MVTPEWAERSTTARSRPPRRLTPPLWTHHLTYIVRVEDIAPGQPLRSQDYADASQGPRYCSAVA